MIKPLIAMAFMVTSSPLMALADPSREISEPGDQQKIDLLYKKSQRFCKQRNFATHKQ